MKKLIVAGVLALALVLPASRAFAIPPSAIAGSSSGALTASLFMLGVTGEIALIYAIAEGVDPWTPVFLNVAYDYPAGMNGR